MLEIIVERKIHSISDSKGVYYSRKTEIGVHKGKSGFFKVERRPETKEIIASYTTPSGGYIKTKKFTDYEEAWRFVWRKAMGIR